MSKSLRPDWAIIERPIDELTPNPRNARTHSRKQLRQIANSIERFGFTNPVLIDDDGQILAGHGRVEAARLLGLKQVPTLMPRPLLGQSSSSRSIATRAASLLPVKNFPRPPQSGTKRASSAQKTFSRSAAFIASRANSPRPSRGSILARAG